MKMENNVHIIMIKYLMVIGKNININIEWHHILRKSFLKEIK